MVKGDTGKQVGMEPSLPSTRASSDGTRRRTSGSERGDRRASAEGGGAGGWTERACLAHTSPLRRRSPTGHGRTGKGREEMRGLTPGKRNAGKVYFLTFELSVLQ